MEDYSMKKIIALSIIILFTIGLLGVLINFMRIDSFSFAVALNFLLMSCVLVFVENLKSTLNSPYFNLKSWEMNGKLYEIMGINVFRKLLVLIGWEKLNKKTKPVDKNMATLMNLHYRTKLDELAHLIIFVIVAGVTGVVASKFGFLLSLWLIILNLLLNLYPICLQRYNRPRIERVIGRK